MYSASAISITESAYFLVATVGSQFARVNNGNAYARSFQDQTVDLVLFNHLGGPPRV